MASATESAPQPVRADDMETGPERMNDDDFDYDDMADELADGAEAGNGVAQANTIPVWRLIEMSRENRLLQEELADFEDYDCYDGIGGDYAGLSR